MFWRSVVGKLAITILLLVSFVLFILTILLLEFFEGFHVQEAEKAMIQTATKVSLMVEEHEDDKLILDTIESVKDPSSKVAVVYKDGAYLSSNTEDNDLAEVDSDWIVNNEDIINVLSENVKIQKKIKLPSKNVEMLLVGTPVQGGNAAVIVLQSLDIVNQTEAETTRIIFLAAGIAIVLTTIFAFFLSTRITSPLIKMREAAFDLTRGEFNTQVPILTHDEIGELAIAFNRMGRQLNFHINALRQEKEQLVGIVSSMADGVITLNREGEMIVINPPAEMFLEDWYYEHSMDNETEVKKLPLELNQLLELVIAREEEVLQDINLQGRNWTMIMTPLYDQSYVRGAVAVIRDMTEERRLDKLRKDFIANVSHELRTPISLMQGYSEAIVDDVAESKEDKNELAQIIQDESLRMGRLVNELLDLGRMEAGHIQLNRESVEVEKFINRVLNKFNNPVKNNKITINYTKQIDDSESKIDVDRIEQVFTNLIQNALNHIGENGIVDIFVENTDEFFLVEISDNGTGISDEDLPFIFERFYKADKSRTRSDKKKGTGLGLAIAKNIIEAHNGTISAKSKENVGTTFSFKVPNVDE